MKNCLLLSFVLFSIFSLTAQSHQITVGGVFRNTNHLAYTGQLPTGLQLGYNYRVSDELKLQANFGYVTNASDIERGNVIVYQNRERTDFFEAYAFVPFLQRWFPAKNVRFGFGYTGSRNEHDYAESALANSTEVVALDTRESVYYLHEVGTKIEFTQPLSDQLAIVLSGGGSGSLNRAPAFESTITYTPGSGPDQASSVTKKNSRHIFHYQVALSVGYTF